MPEKPNGEVENLIQPDSSSNEIVNQVRRQEDLTLTDHVNRRLLTSFLTRINTGAPDSAVANAQNPEQASNVPDSASESDDFAA